MSSMHISTCPPWIARDPRGISAPRSRTWSAPLVITAYDAVEPVACKQQIVEWVSGHGDARTSARAEKWEYGQRKRAIEAAAGKQETPSGRGLCVLEPRRASEFVWRSELTWCFRCRKLIRVPGHLERGLDGAHALVHRRS